MAGFETVVRPVVFPVIRPTPAQSVAQKDNPNQGKAVITGSGGKSIDLPYSYSVSSSQSKPTETRRRVDTMRVYQKDDDGNVNRDTFVDIDVANKIWMVDPKPMEGHDAMTAPPLTTYYYARVPESDNVELRERDKIVSS